MTSVDYIITARHYAEREGCESVRERILKMRQKIHKTKNIALQVLGIDDPSGQAVEARIWQGQWVADCDCGGCEFVDPEEQIFYCFSCGNRANNNRVRPVLFPADRAEIEQLVLARPVDDRKGLTDLEQAGLAKALVIVQSDGAQYSLVRSWTPGESAEDLAKQNAILDGLVIEKGKVVVVDIRPVEPLVDEPVVDVIPTPSEDKSLEGESSEEVKNVI